jgi:hypothetical protein
MLPFGEYALEDNGNDRQGGQRVGGGRRRTHAAIDALAGRMLPEFREKSNGRRVVNTAAVVPIQVTRSCPLGLSAMPPTNPSGLPKEALICW